MKLITLYKAILDLGGMSADRDGFVSGKLIGSTQEPAPVTIKGKRLVLPTQKQLSTPDWSDRIVFHPLYENVLRGESQVIEKLRNLIMMRINVTIGVLGAALLELAGNTAEHSKLNPDQSMFLAKVRMLDAKSLDNWKDLLKALEPAEGKQNFVYMFLKRSGSVAGKKHARVGVVTFPVMKALVNDEKVFGYKPRNKDREVFKNLMEYLFNDILNDGAYNAGSDSSIAPYTDAMMRTFLRIMAPLNDVIDLFADILPELTDLRFNSDWVDELDKLESYHVDIRSIPMQAGNEGTSLVKGVAPTQEVPQEPMHQTQAVVQPTPTSAPAPAQTWQPAPTQPVGYQFPQHQFTPAAAPVAPVFHPNLGWVQPAPAPVAAMAPSIVKGKDGADFGSILASNPTLAMTAAAMAFPQQQQMMMMQQQQQSVPRFAQAPMMGGGFGGMPPMGYQPPGYGMAQGGMGMMPGGMII